MLKIGVTGGIGSGKSLVCSIIARMGYPVYDADVEARKLTNTNPEIIGKIKELFDENIYRNNELDRKSVAELAFNNTQILQKLNAIIHPAVKKHFENWVTTNSTQQLVFKEAAILFESGAYKQLDKIVAVVAPIGMRVERVSRRDGVDSEQVLSRINNQIDDSELKQRSHYVIINNQQGLLIPQIVCILDDLKQKVSAR